MSRSLRDLMGRNIVIYDLETKVPVDQCSKGWSSMDEMGISVGALFDYRTLRYRIFLQDNMQELIDRLNEANTLIVAFNHIWFDNRLLRASKYALKDDKELNNYDMLVVSRKGANAPFNAPGFKLDDHLEALNLPLKTGSGVNAPIWWQEGKYGKVIDYALSDVTQERALFQHLWVTGMCGCKFKNSYPIELPQLPELEGKESKA